MHGTLSCICMRVYESVYVIYGEARVCARPCVRVCVFANVHICARTCVCAWILQLGESVHVHYIR